MLKTIVKACKAVLHPGLPEAAEASHHCLAFSLDGIRFGIDTRMINRIVRYGILAEPIDKPACVRGFQRCDGVMIPVLDIAAHYGNQPLALGRRTCLLVVGLGHGKWRRDVGVMVDEVLSVVELKPGEVSTVPPAMHQMVKSGIVEGIVRQKNDFLILLDAMCLLPDSELEALAAYMRRTWE